MSIYYSPLGLMKTNGSDRKLARRENREHRACWENSSAGGDVGTGWYKEDVLMCVTASSIT